MKIQCPKCKAQYDVDCSIIGRKVECVCGKKWILREKFPRVLSARSINEDFEESLLCVTLEEALLKIADIKGKMKTQYEQYLYLRHSSETEDQTEYEKLKYMCACESPVPAVFKEFFKMCRKKNTADKKENKNLAVVDRIRFMIELDQKKRDIIWRSTAKHNGISRGDIDAHYCSITITDRKNLDFCWSKIERGQ